MRGRLPVGDSPQGSLILQYHSFGVIPSRFSLFHNKKIFIHPKGVWCRSQGRAKAAKLLYHFLCAHNSDPNTKLSYPVAVRVKGYSNQESKDWTSLLMKVGRIAEKLSPPSSLGPPVAAAAAATALLSLAPP